MFIKSLFSATLLAALLLPVAGAFAAPAHYAIIVENGVSRKVDVSSLSDSQMISDGFIKTSDSAGNPVYLRNKPMMPTGPVGAGHKGNMGLTPKPFFPTLYQ